MANDDSIDLSEILENAAQVAEERGIDQEARDSLARILEGDANDGDLDRVTELFDADEE